MAANIAFILICSGLVFLMTPALAFFYGGLERRKNILNTMMMVICTMGLASLIWIVIGYSLSFSGDGDFIGNLDKVLFNGVSMTKGDGIPEGLFAFFQMMFALITTAILTGSVAGRMRFSWSWFTFQWHTWFGAEASLIRSAQLTLPEEMSCILVQEFQGWF